MWPAIAVAAACGAWQPDVTGTYVGVIVNRGVPTPFATRLELDGEGHLHGRYVVRGPGPVIAGTLAFLRDDGCHVALFRWTDPDGTGVQRLQFFPAEHCFQGAWGDTAPDPSQTMDTCKRSTPIS